MHIKFFWLFLLFLFVLSYTELVDGNVFHKPIVTTTASDVVKKVERIPVVNKHVEQKDAIKTGDAIPITQPLKSTMKNTSEVKRLSSLEKLALNTLNDPSIPEFFKRTLRKRIEKENAQ